jgi:1-deoxy-D-xylulose 5-phosphate reductoisomerase
MKKKIIILGSTGSLGKSTLDIINNDKKNYSIELLVANKNFKTIYKQVIKFKPKFVYLADKIYANRLSKLLKNNKTKIISNFDEINKKISKSDIMMSSITGLDGLKYNLSLIKKAKKILFANKESIICGWNLIKKEMDKYNTSYVPVDSEHFAISELIKNKDIKKIKKYYNHCLWRSLFHF